MPFQLDLLLLKAREEKEQNGNSSGVFFYYMQNRLKMFYLEKSLKSFLKNVFLKQDFMMKHMTALTRF